MDRLIELGKKIWSSLTEEEQEKYFMIGTLTFIDNVVRLLNIDDFDDNDIYSIDDIHYQIFGY